MVAAASELQAKKAERLGDGAADYEQLTELLLQQCAPTELCSCSRAYPSVRYQHRQMCASRQKAQENCCMFSQTCFLPSIHPSTSLRLYCCILGKMGRWQ